MIRYLRGAGGAVFRAGAVLGAAALCLAGVVPAQAAITPGWQLTTVYGTGVQNYDPLYPGGLAVPARHAAWMIWTGCNWPCDPGDPVTVVEHWNGQNWAPVPAADLHGMTPGLVTASSASDAWLFGSFPKSRYDGALRWNGKTWAKVTVPTWVIRGNGSGEAEIDMIDLSPTNLWVFSLGTNMGEKTWFAAHYQDGRWTKSYLPDIPTSATELSANDIWVLGQPVLGSGTTVIMRWNGHKWSATPFPKQSVAGLAGGLTAVGPEDVWSSWSPAKKGAAEYLLHWTGDQWSKVSLPAGDSSDLLTSDGRSGLWAVGNGPAPKYKEILLHLSSAGRWSVFGVPLRKLEVPGNVSELSVIPGTTSLWGVGHVYSPGGGSEQNRVAIWRYNP
jgi:hypothetical protein